jgi:hypothetical protein
VKAAGTEPKRPTVSSSTILNIVLRPTSGSSAKQFLTSSMDRRTTLYGSISASDTPSKCARLTSPATNLFRWFNGEVSGILEDESEYPGEARLFWVRHEHSFQLNPLKFREAVPPTKGHATSVHGEHENEFSIPARLLQRVNLRASAPPPLSRKMDLGD